MNNPKAKIAIIAGPHGSGKSTITKTLFEKEVISTKNYINLDDLFREKNDPMVASNEANNIKNQAYANRESLAIETVFLPKFYATEAKANGYDVELFYVLTESPEINIKRVEQRVREGGHDINNDVIYQGYKLSLQYLPEASKLADRFVIYDNSGKEPKVLAEKAMDGKIMIYPQVNWSQEAICKLLDVEIQNDHLQQTAKNNLNSDFCDKIIEHYIKNNIQINEITVNQFIKENFQNPDEQFVARSSAALYQFDKNLDQILKNNGWERNSKNSFHSFFNNPKISKNLDKASEAFQICSKSLEKTIEKNKKSTALDQNYTKDNKTLGKNGSMLM